MTRPAAQGRQGDGRAGVWLLRGGAARQGGPRPRQVHLTCSANSIIYRFRAIPQHHLPCYILCGNYDDPVLRTSTDKHVILIHIQCVYPSELDWDRVADATTDWSVGKPMDVMCVGVFEGKPKLSRCGDAVAVLRTVAPLLQAQCCWAADCALMADDGAVLDVWPPSMHGIYQAGDAGACCCASTGRRCC